MDTNKTCTYIWLTLMSSMSSLDGPVFFSGIFSPGTNVLLRLPISEARACPFLPLNILAAASLSYNRRLTYNIFSKTSLHLMYKSHLQLSSSGKITLLPSVWFFENPTLSIEESCEQCIICNVSLTGQDFGVNCNQKKHVFILIRSWTFYNQVINQYCEASHKIL